MIMSRERPNTYMLFVYRWHMIGCMDRKTEEWRLETLVRVFRGLLLEIKTFAAPLSLSCAFSKIQSACQVMTILYFSANLVKWGPLYLVDRYLSGNVYHS